METNKKLLIAAGAGLAIGGILGILFAPDKGSETRKKIKNGGTKISDNFKQGISKLKGSISNAKEEIKERIDGVEENMNEYI